VAQPTVSARHCRLRAFGRGYVIEDLGSTNGTFVNQQRIDRPTRVHRGDSITLGKKVPMPWPEDARVVLRTIRIGAAPDNDVVLAYPYISGHHARLLVGERDLVIEDLGSTNGTAVGDRRNRVQRAAIAAGDVVYFGSHPVRVSKLLEAGRR
jgi:pSer/pThr/pTyr-binding forkhead associated (FHA) protein